MISLASLGVTHRIASLSNGTRVVVFERPGAPVYIRASFLSGSRYDKQGKGGTAHFLEHMVLAGTRSFPTKDRLAATIEQYGGEFGATTGLDTLNVNIGIGDPADLEKAFMLLHEMLFESLFDAKTLETERGSIFGELRERLANPAARVWDIAWSLVFHGSPLSRPVLGTRESIQATSKDDIIEFLRANVTAGRMLLAVSGGTTLEKVTELAEELLLLPSGDKAVFDEVLPAVPTRKVGAELFVGKEQIHSVMAHRTVGILHPDSYALDVIAEVLGGGRASVLSRALRYERGLVYAVRADQYSLADVGAFVVKTSAAKEKMQDVLNITATTLERVAHEGLTTDEVQFAKDKIMKSKRMELQTSASWVGFHAYRQLLSRTPWTLIDYLKDIEAVTPEETRRVAKKYFTADNRYLALCGDLTEDEMRI